jgi:RNA polymerase sigma-70 factor (ECF subfamily)
MQHLSERAEVSEAEQRAEAELALVVAARSNPDAFAPLYRRYVEMIYRFCYRRLGTREEAEDATSITFQKALRALHRFHGGSFRAWLFAIADRTTLDRLRRGRREQPLDDAFLIPDRTNGPEALVLGADARDRLREALSVLTADQRRVIELRLSGLDTAEIAQAMERNRNAIDALQFRAVQRLRQVLIDAHPEGLLDG